MMCADRPLAAPFRRPLGWRSVALLLALLTPMTCNGQEAAPAGAGVTSNEFTTEAIDAELAALELKPDLDDTTKAQLVDMLQQAKTTLLRAQSQREAAKQFEQIIAGAPTRLAEIQAKLDAPAGSEAEIDDALSLTDVTQKLATLKVELTAATKQVADLSDESTRRRARLTEIPGLLTEAEREHGEVLNQQSQPAPANETATESQIRSTLLAARAQETSARIESLQNEQAAYAATADLLPLERKLAEAYAAQLKRQSDLLQAIVMKKQKEQVKATKENLQQTVDAVPQSLREVAQQNVELAEIQKQLIEQAAETEKNLLGVQTAVDEVKADQKSSKARITAVGLTDALGVMLRQQREEAKALRYEFRPRDDLNNRVEQYQLSTFTLEDELSNLNQWLDQRDPLPIEWDKSEISWNELSIDEAEWVLNRKRRQLIEETLESQNAVLRSMLISDTQRRELILLIDEFTAFVDVQLFWTKDAPSVSIEEFVVAPKLMKWVSMPASWANAVKQMILTVTLKPLASLSLVLVAIAVLMSRRRVRRLISHEGEAATKINVGYQSTVYALGATFVAAMAWPISLATFAYLLLGASPADPFVRGLGYAFGMVALYVSSRELLSKVCRDNGVAECHFGWMNDVRRHLRRHLRWYTLMGGLIVFPMAMFNEHPDANVRIFAIRYTSTALFLLTAAFHHLMLRKKSPLYVQLLLDNPQSIVVRMQKLLWSVAVLVPILFAMMALAGYLETTFRLGHSLQSTFLLLVVIVLVYGLLSRWLMLRRRDLARRKAMELRQRRLNELDGTEGQAIADQIGITLDENNGTDIDSLDEQGRQTAIVFASLLWFVGLALIWSDLVPALTFFDDVSIGSVGTGENIESVSLLDLFYSVLCVVLMVYATKSIPRIFELLVRGRTSLDAGARYAIATLLRYVIIVGGGFIVLNLLSVPYYQLGWLLAAASVGLGFGLQEIVANFVSGIILLLERPVRVGDVVTIDGTTGVVSRIQMRATTVTSWDRKELVIPNKDLITQKLLNWSLTNVINRISINVGVSYGSDPDQVRELLRQVVLAHPEVLSDPPPSINFDTFGDSSLNFVVRFFLEKLENRIEVTHQINTAIANALAKADITIPFPQRDLHVDVRGDDHGLLRAKPHSQQSRTEQ